MLFSRDDFQIDDFGDLLANAPVFIFVAFVAPFIVAAYSLDFIMDAIGWIQTTDKTLGDF